MKKMKNFLRETFEALTLENISGRLDTLMLAIDHTLARTDGGSMNTEKLQKLKDDRIILEELQRWVRWGVASDESDQPSCAHSALTMIEHGRKYHVYGDQQAHALSDYFKRKVCQVGMETVSHEQGAAFAMMFGHQDPFLGMKISEPS